MDATEHDLIIVAAAVNAYLTPRVETKIGKVSPGQKTWLFKHLKLEGQSFWKWSFYPYYVLGMRNSPQAQWRQIGRYEQLK